MSSAALLKDYAGIWNTIDDAQRSSVVRNLWAENGLCATRSLEARGHTAIEARVTSAVDQFVRSGRFVFGPAGDIDEHHGVVRFRWAMTPREGGPPAATGTDFLMLDDNGKIVAAYQFNDPAP